MHDRLAALTLSVAKDAVHRLPFLDNLQTLCARAQKNQKNAPGSHAFSALSELYLRSLLPDDRPLRTFADCVRHMLLETTTTTTTTTTIATTEHCRRAAPPALLMAHVEGTVKLQYAAFVDTLERSLESQLDVARKSALRFAADLLAAKPEQEQALLALIANKLGDPDVQVSSAAVHRLLRVLEQHPAMRPVVVRAALAVCFRANVTPRTQYYAMLLCNQVRFRAAAAGDAQLADTLLQSYFRLLRTLVRFDAEEEPQKRNNKNKNKKKKPPPKKTRAQLQQESKLLGAVLTGVQRALPYASAAYVSGTGPDSLEHHARLLLAAAYQADVQRAMRALAALFTCVFAKDAALGRDDDAADHNSGPSLLDSYYSALYHVLLAFIVPNIAVARHARLHDAATVAPPKRSTHTMLFSLLYRSLVRDSDTARVAAILYRLLCVATQSAPNVAICSLLLTSALALGKNDGNPAPHAALKTLFLDPVTRAPPAHADVLGLTAAHDDDEEEEHFHDVSSSDASLSTAAAAEPPTTEPTTPAQATTSTFKPFALDPRRVISNLAQVSALREALFYQLALLSTHVHPTIAHYAAAILRGEAVLYDGDPMEDFTSIGFLERFSFKNPKQMSTLRAKMAARNDAGSQQLSKGIDGVRRSAKAPAVNSDQFLRSALADRDSVRPDERFFVDYFALSGAGERLNEKTTAKKKRARSSNDEEDELAEELFDTGDDLDREAADLAMHDDDDDDDEGGGDFSYDDLLDEESGDMVDGGLHGDDVTGVMEPWRLDAKRQQQWAEAMLDEDDERAAGKTSSSSSQQQPVASNSFADADLYTERMGEATFLRDAARELKKSKKAKRKK